jgi:hypothetical protein
VAKGLAVTYYVQWSFICHFTEPAGGVWILHLVYNGVLSIEQTMTFETSCSSAK